MPVLLYIPKDPTDLVLQGEHLRQSVSDLSTPMLGSVGCGAQLPCCTGVAPVMLSAADAFAPMDTISEGGRLAQRIGGKDGVPWPRVNDGIATPMGAWLPEDRSWVMPFPAYTSVRWALVGITRDGAGTALGNCRVIAFSYGRMAREQTQAYIDETISDGSGNYSIEVGTSQPCQVIAYLAGSPNKAGTSDIVTPTAI